MQKRREKAAKKSTDFVGAAVGATMPAGPASPKGAFPIVGIGASAG